MSNPVITRKTGAFRTEEGCLSLDGVRSFSMGVVRTTYLIDEEGNIEKSIGKVKADENPAQMLELLNN